MASSDESKDAPSLPRSLFNGIVFVLQLPLTVPLTVGKYIYSFGAGFTPQKEKQIVDGIDDEIEKVANATEVLAKGVECVAKAVEHLAEVVEKDAEKVEELMEKVETTSKNVREEIDTSLDKLDTATSNAKATL